MNPYYERRFGRFELSMDFIFNNFELVENLMKNIIVLDARGDFVKNVIEYKAVSRFFSPVEKGKIIPQYDILFKEKDIELKRREND